MWTAFLSQLRHGTDRRVPHHVARRRGGPCYRVVGVGSALMLAERVLAHLRPTPAVPPRSELVTIVPFYREAHIIEERNQWAVFIMAEVDGHRGVFMLDTGSPIFSLNRTFLQPSPTGGIDTVTDANRLPDHVGNTVDTWGQVHIKDVRIGTLDVNVVEPTTPASDPRHVNAFLNHIWNNYVFVDTPRLGNIGLSVLEPFETIVDYRRQCVVLIRLDSTGHRLAAVPEYTPKWITPLIDKNSGEPGFNHGISGMQYWGIAVYEQEQGDPQSIAVDTANDSNDLQRILAIDTGSDEVYWFGMIGYNFLHKFGAIGFNHRTHQFIGYQ